MMMMMMLMLTATVMTILAIEWIVRITFFSFTMCPPNKPVSFSSAGVRFFSPSVRESAESVHQSALFR